MASEAPVEVERCWCHQRIVRVWHEAGGCPDCGLPWSMCDCEPEPYDGFPHDNRCAGDRCAGTLGIGKDAPPCLCWCHNGDGDEE